MKTHNRKLLTQALPPLQPTATTPSPLPSGQSLTWADFYKRSVVDVLIAVLINVLIVLLLVGCVFICIYIRKRIRQRYNADTDSDADSPRRGSERTTSSPPSDLPTRSNLRKGLDPLTIRALPVHSYCGDAEEYQTDDCAICLLEFEEKDAVKLIPFCKHVFHPVCIDMWLSSHVTCPVCRSSRFPVRRGVWKIDGQTMTREQSDEGGGVV
ncbi:RING-H2 finger protein ATL57-like [Corylus avellana]|uniref:RING-H2 finger protein ATL57-like n=1 Tax=Corylus avellana TaxID=13451 RepID=UPI00286ABE50|nr:RING-H2 finger protein ATL57-like [Corylus avellana]